MRSAPFRLLFSLFFVAGITAAGCQFKEVDPGSGGGDAGTAGGGGGSATACEGKSSCAECVACAQSGPCAQLVTACENDATCVGLDQCMQICGADQECQQGCFDMNPTGVQSWTAVVSCYYCTECPNDCKGYKSCL